MPTLPLQIRTLREVRCGKCGRLAGKFSGGYETKCHRCGAMVAA